jgi:hypothetical protein
VLRLDERSRPMRRLAPSVIAREQLYELLAGGVDRESNIVSALVESVTRLVIQELLEGEQSTGSLRPRSCRAWLWRRRRPGSVERCG